MFIKKLTLTPVSKRYEKTVERYVDPGKAGEMIKARLWLGNSYDDKISRPLRKLPKQLKGWVNPKYLVVKDKFIYV